MTFLNCRGNIELYSDNDREVIAKLSDAVVIVLDKSALYSYIPEVSGIVSQFQKSIVVVANPIEKNDRKVFEQFDKICKKTNFLKTFDKTNEKSIIDVASSLHDTLCILDKVTVRTLKQRIDTLKDDILTDEDDGDLQSCRSLAEILIKKKTSGTDITQAQSTFVKEIGVCIKKIHREQNEKKRYQLTAELFNLRQRLLKNVNSDVMHFVKTLVDLESTSVRQIYIQWLKVLTNGRQSLQASSLTSKENTNQKNRHINQNETTSSNKLSLNSVERSSSVKFSNNDLSFYVESLFRELGHLYDSIITLKEDHTKTGLPSPSEVAKVMSDFIVSGNTFELLDGDSFIVPTKWVQLVFDFVSSRLGCKRVLALSVLGLQSSGKSTLLNVMFGSQFRASVGRCTKGINVQLLPVKLDKIQEVKPAFSFVFLIDTEGLRAPELCDQSLDHDNELATVIAGLGDISVLNIMGENTCEIKDILHVVVYAFLRLKLANENLDLHKRCYFTHQNVASVLASEKRKKGLEAFKHNLDEATKESAEMENITDVSSIDDIIEFDITKHVWHIPHLWQGNPPMEFVNQAYCNCVLEIKSNILHSASEMKHKSYKTIKDTIIHAMDLWDAVLSEDFVFSFRNSLEIKAYIKLSDELNKQCRELERSINEGFLLPSEEKLLFCETAQSLENTLDNIYVDVKKEIHRHERNLKVSLGNYIDNAENREITEKWRDLTFKDVKNYIVI